MFEAFRQDNHGNKFNGDKASEPAFYLKWLSYTVDAEIGDKPAFL